MQIVFDPCHDQIKPWLKHFFHWDKYDLIDIYYVATYPQIKYINSILIHIDKNFPDTSLCLETLGRGPNYWWYFKEIKIGFSDLSLETSPKVWGGGNPSDSLTSIITCNLHALIFLMGHESLIYPSLTGRFQHRSFYSHLTIIFYLTPLQASRRKADDPGIFCSQQEHRIVYNFRAALATDLFQSGNK